MTEIKYDASTIGELMNQCGGFFNAMGDDVRRGLFLKMVNAGDKGINVTNLTADTGLSRPAISHHLKVLKKNGLVKLRREGRNNFYYVDLNENLEHLKQFVTCADSIIKK